MTLAEVRPFGDRLIVRPDPKIDTIGPIVLPDVAKGDNPNWFTVTGVVLKLGDGMRDDVCQCSNQQCRLIERRRVNGRCSQCGATVTLVQHGDRRPFDVKVGDRVTFNRFAGKQIEVDVELSGLPAELWPAYHYAFGHTAKLLILREVEVLGVVTGDHVLLPGYEAPAWSQPTSNAGDKPTFKQVKPGCVTLPATKVMS